MIELMITIAVVAILATIAMSVYANYVLSSKLSESFAVLGDYRLKMEQFKQDNRSYADPPNTTNCGITPPAANNYFDFTCAASGAQFTATASNKVGVGMGNAAAYSYTIDQDGVRNTPSFAGSPGPSGIWKNK